MKPIAKKRTIQRLCAGRHYISSQDFVTIVSPRFRVIDERVLPPVARRAALLTCSLGTVMHHRTHCPFGYSMTTISNEDQNNRVKNFLVPIIQVYHRHPYPLRPGRAFRVYRRAARRSRSRNSNRRLDHRDTSACKE